ncbi:MAG: LamG-like jellyroll fold domain-containing protein, partial [Opitutae bacterium]
PSFDQTLNNRTALRIDDNGGNIERFTAYKGGIRWNPAGVEGQASGLLSDVVVLFVWRVDQNGRTYFPFNWGWGDHLPWENGRIYWRYSGNQRTDSLLASNGETVLTMLEYSITNDTQKAYKNSNVIFDQAPRETRYIGGAFFFPGDSGWGTQFVPSFTLGEMLVLRGTITDKERFIYEGYLSHKWGLSNTLPGNHEYKSAPPRMFDGNNWEPATSFAKLYWTDKSSRRNHATASGSPDWNASSQNDLPLMTYSGTNGEYHEWEKIYDIRTVFWVVKKTGSDSNRFLLGDWTGSGSGGDYNFHANGNNYLHSGHASTAYAGTLRENGSIISNPSVTPLPQTLSIVSLKSDSDLRASNFTNDRNINGRTWKGDLAELLIFNDSLEDEEIESIEGYLAHKWGLSNSLEGGHPYKSSSPEKEFGKPFSFGNGQQLEPYYFEFLDYLPAYRENDLISRWDFEDSTLETNGKNRVFDLGPGRNDGFLEGNANLSDGRFGKGLHLDGSGDFLSIPKFRGAYGSENLTFSVWVNLANSGSVLDSEDASIFSTGGTSTSHVRLWYDINSNGIGNRTYSLTLGSPIAASNRASGSDGIGVANTWQFIVGVMKKSERLLYVNGNLVNQSNSPTLSMTLEGTNARIGSWDEQADADFEGLIDEMRIYGVSLSQNDVDAMWNSGTGDLGIVPVIQMNKDHAASEVNGTIRFLQVGNQVHVSGFDFSDIRVEGGTLQPLTSDGLGGYNISITPNRPNIPLVISVSDKAAIETNGTTETGASSLRFFNSPTITAKDRLVLWYNFEGNETNRILDLSDRFADANIYGGKRVAGKFSQSLQLEPGEYLQVSGNDFSFNQTFTLSLWAKILDDEEGIILRNGQVALEYRDDLNLYGSLYTENGWKEIAAPLEAGSWAHYTLTYDSSSFKFYTNGDKKSSTTYTGSVALENTEDRNLYLGTFSGSVWSEAGKFILDDLRVYDRALSESEVLKLYGLGTGDLGIRPQVSGELLFSLSPTSQTISFWEDDSNISVAGLESVEINASGAQLANFAPSDYSYELNASAKPSVVRVSLPHGAVAKDGNLSQAGAFEFQHRTITSVEDDLVAWYTFDQNNTSTISDISGHYRHGLFLSNDLTEANTSNIETNENSTTSYPKSNAFDDNFIGSNDKWLAKWDGSPLYIQYDFDTPTEIGSYAIFSQNADEDIKSPKAWKLEGSDDNANWHELHAVQNQTNWQDWEKRTYALNQSAHYRYFRITFTDTTGNIVPTLFEDLQLWLDATDSSTIVHSSNEVSQWNDKSGHENVLLSVGNPSTNTRDLNSQNVIDFDGNDYFETTGSYPTGNDFSFFMVAGIDTIQNPYQALFAIRQSAGEPSFQIDSSNDTSFLVRYYSSWMGPSYVFSSSAVHGPSLYEFIFEDSSNTLEVLIDGSSLGTTTYTEPPNQQNTLTIFSNRARGTFINGFVGEMIGVRSVLPALDRKKLEGYLAHKWGLSDQLPSNHPLTYLSVGEIEFFPPPEIQNSQFGNGIDLAGEIVQLPFRLNQSAGTTGFSAAIWVRPDSVEGTANNPTILLSSENGGFDWSLGFKSGNPFVRTGSIEATTPQQAFLGQSIHLVGIFNPNVNRTQIYLNGVPAQLNSLGYDTSASRLVLGSDP